MKNYLLSLLGASLVVTLIGILAPDASAKHMKLISALFLICVLITPLPDAVEKLRDPAGSWSGITGEIPADPGYHDQMQEAVNSASKTYFAQTLVQLLSQQFSVKPDEIRCLIRWEEDADQLHPTQVTVILSGSAIWKDPSVMEKFVSDLLGCPCDSAIG